MIVDLRALTTSRNRTHLDDFRHVRLNIGERIWIFSWATINGMLIVCFLYPFEYATTLFFLGMRWAPWFASLGNPRGVKLFNARSTIAASARPLVLMVCQSAFVLLQAPIAQQPPHRVAMFRTQQATYSNANTCLGTKLQGRCPTKLRRDFATPPNRTYALQFCAGEGRTLYVGELVRKAFCAAHERIGGATSEKVAFGSLAHVSHRSAKRALHVWQQLLPKLAWQFMFPVVVESSKCLAGACSCGENVGVHEPGPPLAQHTTSLVHWLNALAKAAFRDGDASET